MKPDPSRQSYYIDGEFYRELAENFSGWTVASNEVRDLALRDSCRMLLDTEARYLEQGRLEDWLSLYAPECVYWVPASADDDPLLADPMRAVAIAFDDRRRIEDRIFRLQNEFAWSQQPNSRTSRLVSNVTVFSTGDPQVHMVRSNFVTTEFQAGDMRTYAGWFAHRLRQKGDGWEILVKQINLINCDQNLRNPSIVL